MNMKAAVLEKPGQLSVRELPDPICPVGGVVVKVLASHVCSTDLHMWQMGHPALRFPRILGHEIAGVVSEVSNGVRRIKEGDKVQVYPGVSCGTCRFCRAGRENLCGSINILGFTLDGGFAQYLALPQNAVSRGCLNPVPHFLPLSEAALAEPLACCLNGLERAALRPGESVLILGAGPIGCLFAKVSKYEGAGMVMLVEEDARRRGWSRKISADAVLDPTEVEVVEAVRELTEGMGADLVVTCFRDAALEYPLLKLVAPGGRILMFSGISGNRGVVPTDLNMVHYRELGVLGAYGCTSVQCRLALELLGDELDVSWLISQRMDLEKLEKTFSVLSSKEWMKVCVEPWEDNYE